MVTLHYKINLWYAKYKNVLRRNTSVVVVVVVIVIIIIIIIIIKVMGDLRKSSVETNFHDIESKVTSQTEFVKLNCSRQASELHLHTVQRMDHQ